MHRLTRTVRFNLLPGRGLPERGPQGQGTSGNASDPTGGSNGEGGKPPMEGFGAHYEFAVRCEGDPDPRTGYLINIKDIDEAVRSGIVPRIAEAASAGHSPAGVLPSLLTEAGRLLPVRVVSVALRLSPYLVIEAVREAADTTTSATNPGSEDEMDTGSTAVIVRQTMEFSAAHRLHVPSLSDEKNAEIFGKCNNPAGHGHNYRIEPAVAVDPDNPLSVDAIERITDEVVIERFDHKHLNDQTAEFATDGGLNPSVENIARVCFGLLDGPIADAGGRLKAVTVWETDRTSCSYPAS